jgi:hypothetical protein
MAAIVFRINLPALQLINQVTSPLQFALLIPLGRAGARILGAGAHPASGLRAATLIADLVGAARNAVTGWFCLCVPLGLVFYLLLLFVLRQRRQNRLNEVSRQKEGSNEMKVQTR